MDEMMPVGFEIVLCSEFIVEFMARARRSCTRLDLSPIFLVALQTVFQFVLSLTPNIEHHGRPIVP